MKKILTFLVAALTLGATMPLHATLIVDGTISGVVTSASDDLSVIIGQPVSGTFSYDYDLLSAPDSSGNRTVSVGDPNAFFSIETTSQGKGYNEGAAYGLGSLTLLTVGANGLPYYGYGYGAWDMGINSSSISLIYFDATTFWNADVTYTITSGVPDTSATWFLLGIGLAGVTVARHFFRQLRV